MSKQFAADLRLARRKAGYTLKDVAHLSDLHFSNVSLIERGHRDPTVEQLCTFATIYGRSFQSFFDDHLDQAKARVKDQLASLPEPGFRWPGSFMRRRNLDRLRERLSVSDAVDGAA